MGLGGTHGEPHWDSDGYVRRAVASFEDTIEELATTFAFDALPIAGLSFDVQLSNLLPTKILPCPGRQLA